MLSTREAQLATLCVIVASCGTVIMFGLSFGWIVP